MLLVGGENLIDLVPIGKQDCCPVYKAVVGGSPLNVAIAAGRQGMVVDYLTPVSSDQWGQMIAAQLTAAGVTVAGGRVDAPTSLAVVADACRTPHYSFYRTATADRQVDRASLGSRLPDRARILHIGSLAVLEEPDGQVWEQFAGTCKKAGLSISFDPNVRPLPGADLGSYRARLGRLLQLADIVKLSDEDLVWLVAGKRQDALEQLVAATAAAIVIVTGGRQGASILHQGSWHEVPAAPVTGFKDAVGAGDVFMATVLAWLGQEGRLARLEQLELAEKLAMVKRACQAAALSCQQHGCVAPQASELK